MIQRNSLYLLKIFCKRIAIKIVDLCGDDKERENVATFMELKLEYIVGFHGYFTEENRLFILMDYCSVINFLLNILHGYESFFIDFSKNESPFSSCKMRLLVIFDYSLTFDYGLL